MEIHLSDKNQGFQIFTLEWEHEPKGSPCAHRNDALPLGNSEPRHHRIISGSRKLPQQDSETVGSSLAPRFTAGRSSARGHRCAGDRTPLLCRQLSPGHRRPRLMEMALAGVAARRRLAPRSVRNCVSAFTRRPAQRARRRPGGGAVRRIDRRGAAWWRRPTHGRAGGVTAGGVSSVPDRPSAGAAGAAHRSPTARVARLQIAFSEPAAARSCVLISAVRR